MDKMIIDLYKSYKNGDHDSIEEVMKAFIDKAYNDYIDAWHIEHIKELVECGLDVNQLSYKSYEMSPLMAAVRACDLELIAWLIKQGADVNQQTSRGATPLLYLTGSSINIYLSNNPNIEAIDHITAILKELLDHGLDLSLKDKEGKTMKECFLGQLITPGIVEFIDNYIVNSQLNDMIAAQESNISFKF